jgi:two-component system phosphate regulon sensor histidine kinase PhoR
MPRTRLVWHLFVGWCLLVAAVLAGCFWLGSVQIGTLATEGERQRLEDLGGRLARSLDEVEDVAARDEVLRQFAKATGLEVELIDPRGVSLGGVPPRSRDARPDGPLPEPAARGQTASASRYDIGTGRRILTVAVPHGSPGNPAFVVRLTTDTMTADAAVGRSVARLTAGSFACGGLAIALGWLLARRAARPVEELCTAAQRLAAGDVDAPLPSAELAELAGLSAAFGRLKEQLVERGLTIGRQGTQQEAVLGSMIEGVLAIDARQRIVGINRAAADLLGVDLDDVVRRPLQEVVRNPDLRRFALTAIDCREPVEDDVVLRGDRDRTLRLRGTALRDVSGEGGAVIVLNDVTDVQRLESVRRDFVANVSHELKTPVASIKGFVETLLDGAADDPAANRRFLEIVARQADRLAAIIDDLLSLSRIEQSEGKGNLPLEPTRLADVIAAVIADCGPRAADRSIRLETRCAEGLVADVNPPLLEQALINLVDNAIKYSDPGAGVWIAVEQADAGLVVRVSDEGCGIEAEHLPRLFERFYRVDRARSRQLGGTGLGLAIVKHIVLAHGGTIGVESQPGVGTTFTMRLPAASAS